MAAIDRRGGFVVEGAEGLVGREDCGEREDVSGVAAGSGVVVAAVAAGLVAGGHLVYFLMDAVRELDIGAITAHDERELRGDPPPFSG